MSRDGYLPPGVTHGDIEAQMAGPSDAEIARQGAILKKLEPAVNQLRETAVREFKGTKIGACLEEFAVEIEALCELED